MFERRSALAGVLGREPPGSLAGGGASVKLGEVRGFSLVQVAAFPNTWCALAPVVEKILGAMPGKAGQSSVICNRVLFRTGAEQFWVVSEANEDLTDTLQSALRADIGAVTSLSHSRTRIFIEGPGARQVLSTGIAIDLNPSLFPVGAVALTGAHHTPVVLHRVGARRYELYVLRTFAVWIWDWHHGCSASVWLHAMTVAISQRQWDAPRQLALAVTYSGRAIPGRMLELHFEHWKKPRRSNRRAVQPTSEDRRLARAGVQRLG